MPVQICFYPNKLSDACEIDTAGAGQSFFDHLEQCAPSFKPGHAALLTVTRNGQPWPVDRWHEPLDDGDILDVVPEPKGATALLVVITAASAYYAYKASKAIPSSYSSTTPTGSSVYSVNAQVNSPKLMGVVPELIGHHKQIPYYLTQQRREWIDHVEYLFLMLCVTVGEIEYDAADILIGETTIDGRDDVDVEIFAPGADVSGNPAHRAEYQSTEVDGLDLQGPVFAEDWEATEGENYYLWQIQNNTKQLRFSTWVLSGGLLYLLNNIGSWLHAYDAVYSDSVDGKIIELYGDTGFAGLYRVVDQTAGGDVHSVEFQKLNSDLTDDTSWTGFGPSEINTTTYHLARWRLWGDDLSRKTVGPYAATPAGHGTSQVRVDINYPGGLCALNGSGQPQYHTSTIQVHHRVNGGAWMTNTHLFTDNTLDERVYTVTINVPDGSRVEVSVSKLSGGLGVTVKDECNWRLLRSEMPTATSYPGWTTMAIQIKGSSAFSDLSSQQISIACTRKLPVLQSDLTWSEPVATRNPVPALRYILQQRGFTDDVLQLDQLHALQQLCESRQDYFDFIFDERGTLWEAIRRVLAVAYCEPTLDFGRLIPVRDEPKTGFAQGFSRANVSKDGITCEIKLRDPSSDEYDGVEVEWMDPSTWKSATVLCTLADEAGENPQQVRAYGIIDKTHAYRYGMRLAAINRYRRKQYRLSTDMQGLNCGWRSRIGIGWDVPGYSQTGRVTAVSGLQVVLDFVPEWGTGTHYIGLQRPNGSLSGPHVCTPGDAPDTVLLAAALDFVPDLSGRIVPPYAQFGEADSWTIPALVSTAKPAGINSVSITAEIDDPRVYDLFMDVDLPSELA